MIRTFAKFGYEGAIVTVEVDIRRGIPATDIVGLADSVVKESRDRMIAAIKNSCFTYPEKRVLISLSPADIRKEGTAFDLSLALAVLSESEKENELHSQDEDVLVLGELELSGCVRSVRGITAALQTAVENGIKYAIIPKTQEAIPDGILVSQVNNLTEAFGALRLVDADETYESFQELVERQEKEKKEKKFSVEFLDSDSERNLDNLDGYWFLKYAMTVAVAGRHHILAFGKPGCGKTMIFQHMTEIMPKLFEEESQSVKRIYSIAGMPSIVENGRRPFRVPHQSASLEGMCGGGKDCRPGEITLAHNGVLFLDEAAEFRTSVLQMLRIPLESGCLTLSRAGRHTTYPAKFQLAMATNPCPCGNYGSDRVCLCSAKSIEQYWKKFSGPLIDRIGIRVNCNEEKDEDCPHLTLEDMRAYVANAWEVQYKRQGKLNQDLTPEEMYQYISLTAEAERLLKSKEKENEYSKREIYNILKIARTIADANTSEETPNKKVSEYEISKAIQLCYKFPLDME